MNRTVFIMKVTATKEHAVFLTFAQHRNELIKAVYQRSCVALFTCRMHKKQPAKQVKLLRAIDLRCILSRAAIRIYDLNSVTNEQKTLTFAPSHHPAYPLLSISQNLSHSSVHFFRANRASLFPFWFFHLTSRLFARQFTQRERPQKKCIKLMWNTS